MLARAGRFIDQDLIDSNTLKKGNSRNPINSRFVSIKKWRKLIDSRKLNNYKD